MNPPTVGSLFAGIGGFDLGFERAGFRIAWQVEIDEFCRKVLTKHWPDVRRHDDVRTFPPEGDWQCDVIVGGFPCKQTSAAAAIHGRRNGLAGADSGLWFDMLRIIRTLASRAVVIENPPSPWLRQVQGGLEGAGYAVSRLEATARGVGAPHRRRRVFLVAHLDRSGLEATWATGPSAAVRLPGRASSRDSWVSALGSVLRVDDGFSRQLDRRERITALGNAVVPQVAEWIARRLMKVLTQE